MEIYNNPPREQWGELCRRPLADSQPQVAATVAAIVDDVKSRGDAALFELEARFTGASLTSLRVSAQEIADASALVSRQLKDAIATAAANITAFHSAQRMKPLTLETMPGVVCSQRQVPIAKVGLYIPGGNSPLFSTVLMLALPARIAGCRKIVMCTPADASGSVHPAILYAASVAGVTEIYKTGGAQAIAAMACGTETVPAVSKIFGPGNRYVMEAKQQVSRMGVAIDMPAGPSEVMIVADDRVPVSFLAADFLSQAEHGPDSQSILLTASADVARELPAEIESQLSRLPRRAMMEKSLQHSRVVVLPDNAAIMALANLYAPEHLILAHHDWRELAAEVSNAGSVFLGYFTPESAGDYASGTNHTLPTSGYACAYSGVNLDSFCKKITFQHITPRGARAIGPAVQAMAEAESLMAHRNAMALRTDYKEQQ